MRLVSIIWRRSGKIQNILASQWDGKKCWSVLVVKLVNVERIFYEIWKYARYVWQVLQASLGYRSNLPSGRPYIILVRHISDKNDNIATM